jgi:hypothetical protein
VTGVLRQTPPRELTILFTSDIYVWLLGGGREGDKRRQDNEGRGREKSKGIPWTDVGDIGKYAKGLKRKLAKEGKGMKLRDYSLVNGLNLADSQRW